MSDRKITALTELTAPVATDVFPIIDVSESANANKNKKIQLTTILRGIPNGSASAPSVGFIDDTGTSGLFRVTDDEIGISCNQTQIASFATAGLKLGSGTIAAQLHLFSTDTTDQVIIENTDAGADTAPDLVLFRNSASPADNDNLGNLIYRGKDDNGDSVEYASIVAQIADATNSSEDGILDLMSTAAGTLASRIRLKSEFVGIHEADPLFPLHLTTADTTSGFCIESTLDSDASSADILLYHRRGTSGAGQDNDLLSSISFQGKNDAGTPEEVIYAVFETKIIDASDASEDGQINLKSMVAGTLTTVLTVDSNGATVVGDVVVSGLVDGVDIATRDALFGGLTSSSGVLTNGVTATTQSASDNSTKVATTAYIDTAIANLIDSSPSTLNTLNELASALGDDPNFATTVTNSIATKMPLAGGTFTGDVTFTGDSANVVFDKSDNALEFADDARLKFGSGGDVDIRHNGTRTMIRNHGIGQIHFDLLASGNAFAITKANLTETIAKFTPDGSVDLYYDNVKKLETTNNGVTVSGDLLVSRDGNATINLLDTGHGFNASTIGLSNGGRDLDIKAPKDIRLKPTDGESGIVIESNAAVELYHDNIKRLETASNGAACHGILTMHGNIFAADNHQLQLGTDADLSLLHNGTDSKITNNTFVTSGNLLIEAKGGETAIKIIPDGAVELYYNNVEKLKTQSWGVNITGTVNTNSVTAQSYLITSGDFLPNADNSNNLGSSTKRFSTLHSVALNTGDINMSNLHNDGNEVDGSKGSWTLQEGADDLFIINRLKGKKYKINLTEIS